MNSKEELFNMLVEKNKRVIINSYNYKFTKALEFLNEAYNSRPSISSFFTTNEKFKKFQDDLGMMITGLQFVQMDLVKGIQPKNLNDDNKITLSQGLLWQDYERWD